MEDLLSREKKFTAKLSQFFNILFMLNAAGLSIFRYTGKTQKELIDYVRENYVSPTPFERSERSGVCSIVDCVLGSV